jgi:predicted nuclease of predicted toxin-antitoxin system
LSLTLYLDDCAYDKVLAQLLRAAGHTVTIPADLGTTGMDDLVHLQAATARQLIIITRNVDDFDELHRRGTSHSGILAICQDNDPSRDMSHADIVRSIANLENAGVEFAGQIHILNHWRY